jgi:D-alanine-D-alanine ligase
MPVAHVPFSVPVLLLHNVDPGWEHHERDEALRHAHELQAGLCACGHPLTIVAVSDSDLRQCLRGFSPREHIVLNACESVPGIEHSEDLVARELAALGFAFTGAGADVLALSWDKPRVKCLLAAHGIPTPHFRLFRSPAGNGWRTFPAIVKPAYEHCSFGVAREAVVLNASELRSRVSYILDTFHQPALVEDFVDGREFHVAVWGTEELEVLPPAEMDFAAFADVHDRLCTYDSKFTPGSVAYEGIGLRLPAPLSPAEMGLIRQVSLGAYRAVGCPDYARVDIRLRDGAFYVLDVNPNADISSSASMACAAEEAGYSYGAMASRLVTLAARRHPHLRSSVLDIESDQRTSGIVSLAPKAFHARRVVTQWRPSW